MSDPIAQLQADLPPAVAAYQSLQSQVAALQAQLATAQAAAASQPSTGPRHFGVNLEALNYFNRMALFGDAMLQAQAFYNGVDTLGNPTADSTVMVFANATANYAGTYQFICNGNPTLSLEASPGTISGQTYNAATNTTTAQIILTPAQIAAFAQYGPPQIQLQITNVVPGKVNNIQIWRPGCTPGQRFNPAFVKLLGPFDTIRYMDAFAINGSTQKDWTDRPVPTRKNFTANGMAYEDALGLCALTGKTPWLCVPTQATLAYRTALIQLIQSSTSGLVWLEQGNEVWNSAFPQWGQAVALAKVDPTLAYDGTGDPNILLWRWMGKQAVVNAQLIMAAYGQTDIRNCPIRPVLAGQWGNPSVLQYALQFISSQYGLPAQYLGAVAIAPYATLSNAMATRIAAGDPTVTEQQIVADYAASGINNSSLSNALTAQNIALAKQVGVPMKAYEFGFDKRQAQTDVAQKNAAAHDPGMGPNLIAYVNNWWSAGATGLNWFTATCADTSNGQWGLTDDTYNLTTPKYLAAVQAAQATLATH